MPKDDERDEQTPVPHEQESFKDTPDPDIDADKVSEGQGDDAPAADAYEKSDDTSNDITQGITTDDIAPAAPTVNPRPHGIKGVWWWLTTHKKISIPLLIVLLLGVLAAVPATRFALAATVIKQDFQLKIVDATNKKPVSTAKVVIGGKTVTTDGKGIATVRLAVGSQTAEVSKKYFKDGSFAVTVPILKQKDVPTFEIEATGRQVPLAVVNKVTGKPVANVVIKSGEAEAKTDKAGKAILVIPVNQKELKATFSGSGYNLLEQTLKVTTETAVANTAELIPSGRMFFTSNQSGKVDIVSTNLDGSDRKLVLAGTGKEDRYNTYALASTDWKYLALIAKRETDKPKVYLIDMATDTLSTMDEGNADFYPVGWSGHHFVYKVDRKKQLWEDKKLALKSFDASSKKLTTLDETRGEGSSNEYRAEEFSTPYILENEIVYAKNWQGGWYTGLPGKKNTLNSVKPDGKFKRVIKEYDIAMGDTRAALALRSYGPQELYIMRDFGSQKDVTIEEYEGGQIKTVTDVTRDEFYNQPYPTYLVSPSGDRSFWNQNRDASQAFFVGDKEGGNEKEVARLDAEFAAYGWYGDEYLIVSKKSSTLYLMPVAGVKDATKLLKIADYYRAGQGLDGYGYGYGGQ